MAKSGSISVKKCSVAVLLLLSGLVVGVVAQTRSSDSHDQLFAAIRSGDTARVAVLLQSGADVNAKDRRGGATPLMHAAAIGSLDTVRLLLNKGADVKARSSAARRPSCGRPPTWQRSDCS
jgi:uncharacterized protein